MLTLRNRLLRVLMILTLGVIPGAGIECDFDDGEFELDLRGFRFGRDYYYQDYYYEEVWYDPFYPCCFW